MTAWAKMAVLLAVAVAAFAAGWHFATQSAELTASRLAAKHAETAQHVAELATKASELARAAEHTQAEAFNAIYAKNQQDKADAQALADRTIADLRAGNISMRAAWRCPAVAGVPAPAAGAGGSDAAADERAASAARIVRAAAEADAQIRALQAVLTEERKP